ncbi:epoxide hydrolase N-terminal domain-containing protein [Kribbella sp. CA-247076]|uniref:epoxide hydrolase N-terminal domain-containing protein n=1 Tax=Kribbella sp. CA-247076 TaxID=3239941 RepID=UPI003D93DDF7
MTVGIERVAAVRRLRLRVDPGGLYERIRACADAEDVGAGIVPPESVDQLVDYWVGEYDWPAYEKRLNAFEHFATEVGGQFVHFMQSRSAADVVLLTHLWPSGVLEVLETAEVLQEQHRLVIPSIPWTAMQEPTGWDELMGRLGYDEYVVRDDQGATPPAMHAVKGERRGLAPEELAEVRWFNESLNAVNDDQQVRALVSSTAMLALSLPAEKRDSVLTGVMVAWFAPRSEVE